MIEHVVIKINNLKSNYKRECISMPFDQALMIIMLKVLILLI